MPEEKATYCTEHSEAIARMETVMASAKWMLSTAGAVLAFLLTFMGVLANLSLTSIRDDVKDSKTMLHAIQVKQGELGSDVNYLKAWKSQYENSVSINGIR